ncbi:PGG domain containing protein [Parasponia andersonii]|uniref:PGG domain containing protein n=1 Tax=Parasponia andersonii TaxID=3476 RepID=A0A2P5BBC0_PARAD|nr:PGG domain containing protein [Parasponia andersonii]
MMAKDPRVDKGALNKTGTTTIDIIRSSKQLRELERLKTLSMATLEIKGALPSLEQNVIRETTEVQALIEIKQRGKTQAAESKEDEKARTKLVEASKFYVSDKCKDNEPETNSQGYKSLDITDLSSINLLVTTIISAVTFVAAFTMPGGYNEQGMAILSGKSDFKTFLLFDSLAFGCSAASTFVHFLVAAWPKRLGFIYPIYCLTILIELALVALALSFVYGALVVFPQKSGLANLATNSVLLSFPFLLCTFV